MSVKVRSSCPRESGDPYPVSRLSRGRPVNLAALSTLRSCCQCRYPRPQPQREALQQPEARTMANCIVVVQFDLPKRSEEQAIKGGTGSAPTYRNLGTKGLIRKDYLNGDAGPAASISGRAARRRRRGSRTQNSPN